MAKSYDNENGVWRTIGGRRVFIRNGQSLADAMKESGKFSRVAKNKDKYENVSENSTYVDSEIADLDAKHVNKQQKEWSKQAKALEENIKKDQETGNTGNRMKAIEDVERYDRLYDKKVYDEGMSEKKFKEIYGERPKTGLEDIGKEETKTNPATGKPIHKLGQLNETDEEVDISKSSSSNYFDKHEAKRLEIAKDIAKELNPSLKNASEERLEKEAKRLLEAPEGATEKGETFYTNQKGELERSTPSLEKWRDELKKTSERDELAEISGGTISTLKRTIPQSKQDRLKPGTEIYYKGDMANREGVFKIESFNPENEQYMSSITLKEIGGEGRTKKIGAQQIEDSYVNNYASRFAFKEDYDDYRNKIYEQYAEYSKKKSNKYEATKREGFGSYNDDYTPVYNGDIDYTGDFGKTNLSKLDDDEITKALNEQSKQWKEAMNEKVGDRRTRNGRMDQIFKNAKVNKYENGVKRLSEEIDKRGLPRYNIYDVKNKDMILVSSPTKEMAERQLQEMYETDKNLQKSYGWKELPKYEIKESKASAKETEEEMSGNKINNSLRKKGYQKYMKEHPGSKMTLEDYLKKQK